MTPPAPDVVIAHTASLTKAELSAIRDLLAASFDGGFTDHDYEHALGGMHALIRDGDELLAHASLVLRRMLNGSRLIRTGYVEAVAVRADCRRRGYGTALMDALEPMIVGGYQLGALSASDLGAGLYAARGWQRWTGTTSVITPYGRERTPDEDGSVWVLPGEVELSPAEDLACDWRNGDVW